MEKEYPFIDYKSFEFNEEEVNKRTEEFYKFMNHRRSVRDFSDKPVPKSVIDNLIRTASSAPSGANKQPWVFCAISNSALKHRIREMAEKEEKINYTGRMSERWLKDLAHLGTNEIKEFIDVAPWVIVAFKKSYNLDENGEKTNNYYVNESVGLACGFLIAAIHHAGLVTLTHTPSPMNFLSEALNRPDNEKPYLLLPVGYASETCKVPDIKRKPLEEVAIYFE